MKCTRAELWVIGHYSVKYEGDPERVKKAMLGVVHCQKQAAVHIEHEGMLFHWCEDHVKDPTCGVTRKDE